MFNKNSWIASGVIVQILLFHSQCVELQALSKISETRGEYEGSKPSFDSEFSAHESRNMDMENYRNKTDSFLDTLFNRERRLVDYIIEEGSEIIEEVIEEVIEVVKEEVKEEEVKKIDDEICGVGDICSKGFKQFFLMVNMDAPSIEDSLKDGDVEPGIDVQFNNWVYNSHGYFVGKMTGNCVFDEGASDAEFSREYTATCNVNIVFYGIDGLEMGQLHFQGGGGNFEWTLGDSATVEDRSDPNEFTEQRTPLDNPVRGNFYYSVIGGSGMFSGATGQALAESTDNAVYPVRFDITLYKYWYHQYYTCMDHC